MAVTRADNDGALNAEQNQTEDIITDGVVENGTTVIAENGEVSPEMKSKPDEASQPTRDEDDADDKETQCGLGSWRPANLRPLGTIWSFTLTLSVMTVFSSMNFTYYSAVITQIERRFGLSSATTGFIKNIDNIGFMLTVLAVSHLGRYASKPRILSIAVFLSGFAVFIFAVPHFLYGGPDLDVPLPTSVDNATGSSAASSSSRYETCDGVDESLADPSGCSSRGSLMDFNGGALAFFVLSELFQGMSMSPKSTLTMTYMDDNSPDNSPQHIGVLFGLRSFAPLLGFLMGAWTNTIYVDLTDPGLSQRDPRWIGAWWLGFVICAACTVVWALPLVMFPRRVPGSSPPAASANANKDITSNLKDIPRSCWRLLSNPVYACVILGACCNVTLMGFTTFLPKYLESYFGQTAAWASIYTGIVTAIPWTLGPIISGPIVSRLKMTVSRAMRFVICIHTLTIAGYMCIMFLECPQAKWAGTFNIERVSPSMPCNSNCSCDPTAFTPVCGSDGMNYFSPCYAGCQLESTINGNVSITEFHNCQCIDDDIGQASLGMCHRECPLFYVYIGFAFLTFFVTSMVIVPVMAALLRSVDDKDKAMSLAMSSFVLKLAAFPAPILYGRVIDSVCLVLQSSCVRKGACLLYDHDEFRIRLHVLPVAFKLLSLIFFVLSWFLSRRRERQQDQLQQQQQQDEGADAAGELAAGDEQTKTRLSVTLQNNDEKRMQNVDMTFKATAV